MADSTESRDEEAAPTLITLWSYQLGGRITGLRSLWQEDT